MQATVLVLGARGQPPYPKWKQQAMPALEHAIELASELKAVPMFRELCEMQYLWQTAQAALQELGVASR